MYIVRGLPGSGKSTFCRNALAHITKMPVQRSRETGFVIPNHRNLHALRAYILSTDDFYFTIAENGQISYNYDASKIGLYHKLNKDRASIQTKLGTTPLFIDNTNLTVAEMEVYAGMGVAHGYKIVVVEPHMFYTDDYINVQQKMFSPDWLYTYRNTKKIPKTVFEKMALKYEKLANTDTQ